MPRIKSYNMTGWVRSVLKPPSNERVKIDGKGEGEVNVSDVPVAAGTPLALRSLGIL